MKKKEEEAVAEAIAEPLALGDRLGVIKKLIELLKTIDPEKINSVLTFLLNTLTMLFGAAGLSLPAGEPVLESEEHAVAAEAETSIRGIDFALLMQVIKLIMQIIGSLKGTPAPSAASETSSDPKKTDV